MSSNPNEPVNGAARRIAGYGAAVVTAGGFVLLLLMMLSMGMRRGMNHDESQHLAAGAVFGRELLLPYRDFPYFHMPYLVLIYGVLFRWCSYLLLAARVLSVEAGWLTCALMWVIVWRECREKGAMIRWLLPAGAALLLFSNPIFRDAFWRTWNHALGMLFALAAIAFVIGSGRRLRWLWAGIFIGLAIGTRLTFAPLIAPMAVAALWKPGDGVQVRRAGIFALGTTLGLLPALVLFAMAPAQFIFGNLTFNSKINVLFRESYHDPRITLGAKMHFLFGTVLADRANRLLSVVFVCLVAAALIRMWKRSDDGMRFRLLFVLGLIPFAFMGAIAPSPSQHEYYYALVPLVVLAATLSALSLGSGRLEWICAGLLLGAALIATAWSWNEYQRVAILRAPSRWAPVQIHEAGVETAQWVHGGRVLTLEPLQALEGGLRIYPYLVTGGIAWRTEPFVNPGDRERYQMLGPDNFDKYLEQAPPAAVFTAPSSEFDPPLIAWARSHGYVPHLLQRRGKMVDPATVWVAERRADGTAPPP